MNCQDYALSRKTERDFLNLNPLQRGGFLPLESRKALYEFADGYSVCDYCAGRLDEVSKPSIASFLEDLAQFLNVDQVRTVHGAREGKFAVMHAVCEPGDTIVVDGNAHYTTHLAAERNQLNIVEVPNQGYPDYRIEPDNFQSVIDNLHDTDIEPKLAVLTHVDGDYGNLSDSHSVGKITKNNGIPLLLNCAYSMGRMPIDAYKLNADFVVGSGHKSMAASGPIGVLGIREEWEDVLFRRSQRHKVKELELLGCTSRGAPLATLMASFPHVIERVDNWSHELKKTRQFVRSMEEIEGIVQLGIKPKQHDLIRFETPGFHKISEKHPRRGFFLYEMLKKMNIVGIKRGQTQWFKCSVYGFSQEQVTYIANCFKEIYDSQKYLIEN